MTLFKKVFQNQSRPACDHEVPDSAALRRALSISEVTTDPLKLEPFASKGASQDEGFECDIVARHLHDEVEGQDGDAQIETRELESEDNREDQNDGQIELGIRLDTDSDTFLLRPGNVSDIDVTEFAGEDDPTGEQSDEEIAACLGRALAAETPAMARPEQTPVGIVPDLNGVSPAPEAETGSENPPFDSVQDLHEPSTDAVVDTQAEEPLDLSALGGLTPMQSPAVGRGVGRVGRVKTRLLGFNRTGDTDHDPFGQAPGATASAQSEKYPVGWLVIVEGPGVGHAFSIFTGASMIGRGEDQVIRLDFGDNTISRHNHAAIAYDEEQNKFYIGHGGKSNIIRRNARPVLSTEELHHADLIRIGETTLRFVALCGSDFQWRSAGGVHDARN